MLNPNTKSFGCNCRIKENCPLNGECLTPRIIYRATVTNESSSEKRKYNGLADTPFKERYMKSFEQYFKYQCV